MLRGAFGFGRTTPITLESPARRIVVARSTSSRVGGAMAVEGSLKRLEDVRLEDLVSRSLPVDSDGAPSGSGSPARLRTPCERVSGACFSLASPTPCTSPRVVAVSAPALAEVGIAPPDGAKELASFAELLSGNRLLEGSKPLAHCYCGYQFGYFSGQLGDGAAIMLGEVVPPQASAGGADRFELQLKGAGPTKYSRQADGRKVLRSSLREFLCSEAMWALGVPTTRAGSLTVSETEVLRDGVCAHPPLPSPLPPLLPPPPSRHANNTHSTPGPPDHRGLDRSHRPR